MPNDIIPAHLRGPTPFEDMIFYLHSICKIVNKSHFIHEIF